MFVNVYRVCLLLMTILPVVTNQGILTTKFKVFPGYKLLPGYVSIATTMRSLRDCALYCGQQSDCQSVSWNSMETECHLTGENFVSERHSISDASSDWTMVAMFPWPVFNLDGLHGRYTIYSLADAENICLSHEAVIADREDLLAARAMGFNPCACGYMSDGSMGFVMQEANWRCWGSFNTGIVSCDHMYASNVWCKFP